MKITPETRAVADAYFLIRHPGWSWHDLDSAPAEVVRMMRLIEHTEAEIAEARARSAR